MYCNVPQLVTSWFAHFALPYLYVIMGLSQLSSALHIPFPLIVCQFPLCRRHGFALLAVNMPTGERFVYAQSLLHILMGVHNVWPFLSFYDINCKFGPHFRAVAQASGSSGLWLPQAAAWGAHMHMPLPPFHKYMHSAECAASHALELVAAAGLGCGEPTEVLNKYLGIAGTVLQYASKPVRALWLEVLLLAWRLKKEQDLPSLLWRMSCKALAQYQMYGREQEELFERGCTAGVDLAQVGSHHTTYCRV